MQAAGTAYAAAAFLMWGLFPLYFRIVPAVQPIEMVMHRIVWGLLFVLAVLAGLRRWDWLLPTLRQPRRLALFAASAAMLTINWLVYVWAVQNGHVVDAALGYYVNPLLSVLLGVVVLGERLRPVQTVAVALAAAGVAWLGWQAGGLPWIALALAASFGLYGLLRKTAPLGAIEGLTIETLLLAPLAVAGLAWWSTQGRGVWVTGPADQATWLLLSGPLTALPLLCFAAAARRMPLATLGMMQYAAPTLQLLLGVWVWGEPFDARRAAGFIAIWAALALISADALRGTRRGG